MSSTSNWISIVFLAHPVSLIKAVCAFLQATPWSCGPLDMTSVCRRSCASSRATTLTTPRQEASSLGSIRAIAAPEKRQQPPWPCLSPATHSIHSHGDTLAYHETHSDIRIPTIYTPAQFASFDTWHCCTRSTVPHGPRSRPAKSCCLQNCPSLQAWHKMRPGTTFVDVGSNLGLISILAGIMFPQSVCVRDGRH